MRASVSQSVTSRPPGLTPPSPRTAPLPRSMRACARSRLLALPKTQRVDCGAPVPPDATIIKAQGGKPLKEHATLYTVGTLARSTLNTSSRLDDCESRASLRAEVLQRTGMLIAVGGPCCPRRVFAEFGFNFHRSPPGHMGVCKYGGGGGGGMCDVGVWVARIPIAWHTFFLSTSTDLEEAPCYLCR